MTMSSEHFPSVSRMSKDIKQAASMLSDQEARFLVDSYYAMQNSRIREAGRIRAMQKKAAPLDAEAAAAIAEEEEETKSEIGEPHTVIGWLFDQNWTLETAIKGALQRYAESSPVGRWALSQVGIGPVISAGCMAYLDPTWPTVGHIFSFCGMNPTVKWEKGHKRPWSASAKQVAFKIGESMMRQHNHPRCLYGKLYAARKRRETLINERGGYRYQALAELTARRWDEKGKQTEAYKAYSVGKFPKGRIELRARRHAIKMFLSHWHTVAHYHACGVLPPLPYSIIHGGHAHYIAPPGFDKDTFPIAEKVREPRAETLEKAIERLVHTIDVEEAVRLMELE